MRELIEVFSNWYYWEEDSHHRYTTVSGSILGKVAIDERYFVGKSLAELGAVPLHDDGRWEPHRAVLDGHEPFTDFEYTFQLPGGELRYLSGSGQPLFGADGEFSGYRGISRDITTRVVLERRRRLEFEVSRTLAEATSIPEATTAILRAFCELLGWHFGARWEIDCGARSLRLRETWGVGDGELPSSLPLDGDDLLRRACESGTPQWTPTQFAFPIAAGTETLGAIELRGSCGTNNRDEELIQSAVNIGRTIGQFYERKRVGDELLRFRWMMDLSPDLIYIIDPEAMCFLYANETSIRMSGLTREEYMRSSPDRVSGVSLEELKRVYGYAIEQNGKLVSTEWGIRRQSGQRRWFETSRRALRVGEAWVLLEISRDITTRKLAEGAAARQSRMYAALSATNEAIMHATSVDELYQTVCQGAVDGAGFFTAAVIVPGSDAGGVKIAAVAGPGAPRMRTVDFSLDETGSHGRGLISTALQSLTPLVSNEFLADYRTAFWHGLAEETGVKSVAAVPLIRNGKTIATLLLESREKRAFDEDVVALLERVAKNIVFGLDNFDREAERSDNQKRIQHLATHDGLTGLPNRVLFSEMLNIAIQSARRYERKFAVLFIDLDRFKIVNDSLGHDAGDILLREVSSRLRETLRSSDVLSRFGGDEFVVLAQEVQGSEQVTTIARKILSSVMKPINIFGQECRVTASIGISMYPADAIDGQSLMKNADIGMYLAKEEGKNCFQFYSQEMKSKSLERLTLETNLRHALEDDELSLHYQAKVDLRTGAINGVEALLRWSSRELGSVSPMQFIPVAEETALIIPIGRWVLRTACLQNVAWQKAGLPPVCMAVNLSVRQFADPNLLADIAATLEESGMRPELLELEITEGMVIHRPERALTVLRAIKKMGVRLAIDDFGTGYSSLGQLKKFPIDTLKVDRSFIRELSKDSEERAITQAIIAMGKTLSLTVVAEGVETREQQECLRELACDEMQGFYFSKAVAPEDFADLLRNHVPSGSR